MFYLVQADPFIEFILKKRTVFINLRLRSGR